ncbi:hypothetical protein TWF569_003605 [Orbilia oligospora]|nr:hypothetical protein TWF569_003605 [Orbilia oligospora]
MATLQTVPTEIHLHIAKLLLPCDVAALALTCQTLKRRLGHENHFFWYNLLRSGYDSNPTNTRLRAASWLGGRIKFGGFRPENKDYWAEAIGIISGKSDHGCSSCLATASMRKFEEYSYFAYFPVSRPGIVDDGERLMRRYCHQCFSEWHIDLEFFEATHPLVPLPATVGIQISREGGITSAQDFIGAKLKRIIPITTATKAIEDFYGLKFEIANSIPHRFRARWSRIRGEYDAQLVIDALNFIKDIYQQNYKHLQVVMTPETYYKRFSDSLLYFILSDKFRTVLLGRELNNVHASDAASSDLYNEFTIPPLSIAEETMKISRLLAQGSRGRSIATELANNFHVRLFGNPEKFEPQTLIHPWSMVLKMELIRSTSGTVFHPVGVFTWHILYTYLYFMSESNGYQKDWIRCYWCLRQNNGRDTEDNRYNQEDVNMYLSESWIVIHNLVYHPELVRKRPKNPIHDHCTVFSGNSNVYILNWDGTRSISYDSEQIRKFRAERPIFEEEELEDVPEEIIQSREDRISTSRYFHWV